MALSNIFREPRREITEQVAGVAVLIIPAWLDWKFAVWFHVATASPNESGCPVVLGLLFGIFAMGFCIFALHAVHWAGEAACEFLSNRGLELRPRNRR